DVKVTTIRYYESVGIIKEPTRTPGGRRLYSEEAVQALSFVKHGRDLGFSMNAISDLLGLRDSPDQDCGEVTRIAQHQLEEVQKRLRQLESLEAELKRLVKKCRGGVVADCKILSALNDHGECIAEDHPRLEPM
ncbi:MAG: helix-turn-helix domain-containing protein, partial [Cyanobacteria bacterium P01_D01_bin.123]